jgi:hypothetical protein
MTLSPAVEGSRHIVQTITWVTSTDTPVNLSAATITGTIRSLNGAVRAIDGGLSVTNAAAGVFQWDYGTNDVAQAGIFDVQFKATFSSTGQDTLTFVDSWYVAPRLGGSSETLMTYREYDAVRAAIDMSLIVSIGSPQVLPDAVIALPTYHGAAEAYVKARDPEYATRTAAETVYLRNAVIFLTASYLVPSIPFLLREDFGDYNYSRFLDKGFVERHQAFLRSRAESQISLVTEIDSLGSFPTAFDVASGYRGL